MSDIKITRPDPAQHEAAVNGKSDPLAYVDALVAHHHETVFGKGGQA